MFFIGLGLIIVFMISLILFEEWLEEKHPDLYEKYCRALGRDHYY